jgi:hypothetical protein
LALLEVYHRLQVTIAHGPETTTTSPTPARSHQQLVISAQSEIKTQNIYVSNQNRTHQKQFSELVPKYCFAYKCRRSNKIGANSATNGENFACFHSFSVGKPKNVYSQVFFFSTSVCVCVVGCVFACVVAVCLD